MSKIKLICFDLDDTLIQEIHSVMLPCILNGKEKEHAIIQSKEESGELDYISADHLRAELLVGLNEKKISEGFLTIAKPLDNIKCAVDALHDKGIICMVITVGPVQVAKVVCDIWGFDSYFGSNYEVQNELFTGRITGYIKAEDKVRYLKEYCSAHGIEPDECVAIGDGSTDIPLFEYCGISIALNAANTVREKATYAIETQDLLDILDYII